MSEQVQPTSKRKNLTQDVFNAAIDRIAELYRAGHRLVVAFSAGKDSGVLLELSIIAATLTNRLPVEVFMADDEIMLPGTFEYAERVRKRPEVQFTWVSSRQAMPNVFDREKPYWWVFDWALKPEQWVRQPPNDIEWYEITDLYNMISLKRFPPAPGKNLYSLVGIRTSESGQRLMSIHSTGGYCSIYWDQYGVYKASPIYDWKDGDVWKAISENHWDYNRAYDVMLKMGMNKKRMRIAPPTMAWYGAEQMRIAAAAWPKWFDRVCERCPGVRNAAYYGIKAVMPIRKAGESWEQCFMRECVTNAPEWIRTRSLIAIDKVVKTHIRHATTPFPEVEPCHQCSATGVGSWEQLANVLYTGDPYSLKATFLPYVQPYEFRPDDQRGWLSRPSAWR